MVSFIRDQHGLLAQCDVVREKLQTLLTALVSPSEVDLLTELDSRESDDESEEERGEGDGEDVPYHSREQDVVRRSAAIVEEETATLRAEVCRICFCICLCLSVCVSICLYLGVCLFGRCFSNNFIIFLSLCAFI